MFKFKELRINKKSIPLTDLGSVCIFSREYNSDF
jgi:hypothetical protein